MLWAGLPLLLACGHVLAAPRAEFLLVFDPSDPMSVLDAGGIGAALDEQQIPFVEFRLDDAQLDATTLQDYPAVVLAHVALDVAEAAALDGWVQAGGGLLASGRSGERLEAALGLVSLQPLARSEHTEVRFWVEHPVSTGSFWSGLITQLPPMPRLQIPAIAQLLYLDPRWPAYSAQPTSAQVLARWRNASASWFTDDGAPAVLVHHHGAGRTVYLGALPGAYNDPAWHYPLAWRTVIQRALDWTNSAGPSVHLGHWPFGHRAAFALTADAERADMATVVPALLSMFEALGLQRFGTFFVVGQAGGDALTEGAVENPQTVAAIVAAGAEVGGHGDVHTRFAGQTEQQQTERLLRMRDLIEPLLADSGEQLLGFRGPGLAVDRQTYAGLESAGIAYDSSQQDVWSEWTLPHFGGRIWHLPATAPMDYALLFDTGLTAAEWERLTRDKLDYVVERGGLFNWVLHPWLVAEELDRIEALLVDVRDRGDIWMRRLDDLLYWWLQREQLRIEVLVSEPFRLRLQISNDGDTDVAGASVWLRLPARGSPWRAALDGVDQPLLTRDGGDAAEVGRQVVIVDRLAAGGRRLIELSIDRPITIFADGFSD